MSNQNALSELSVDIEILQGKDLIGKDRNLLGKRTTSDPYVKVYHGRKLMGTTKVIKKNLNPVWNERFQFTMGVDEASTFLRAQQQQQNGGTAQLKLVIFDFDKISADDPMGTVMVPIRGVGDAAVPEWYEVTRGTPGDEFCRNAKGQIQVKTTLAGRAMMKVARGQTYALHHNRVRVGLAWDVERGQHIDLDTACVAVGRQGQILMDETVYYGNLTNSNLSIQHSGDETTGEALGDDEKIFLEMDRIPHQVLALYFVLTVATPGKTFADVRSARARFVSTERQEGICQYVPASMGESNTALFLCRIARQNNGSWQLTPIEEGDTNARDFGSLIPEIKGYTRDLVPNIRITQERIAIMRKGGNIRLSDYVPGGNIPKHVTFGLAWDVTNGVNIDLDASAILLDANKEVVDLVSFKQLTSKDGSIRHSGDEREGDEAGDDEMINVSLNEVNPRVKYIGFVINSFSRQELDDIDRAECHLFDPKTRIDIAKYTLTNSQELDKHTALLVACLYRGDSASDWFLRIISLPAQGQVAEKNVDDLQVYLLTNPPQSPAQLPESEIVLNQMPDALLVDEEIVVVPQDDLLAYAGPTPVDQDIVL